MENMIRRLPSQKTKRVKWAPDANLCQIKLFLSEDCPSQICHENDDLQPKASWMLHSSEEGTDLPPPGFGGNGFSPSLKETCVPQTKWRCPPRFILNSDWHVVAGEGSQESGTQKSRELRVLEAWYPRLSDIPPSPILPPNTEDFNYNDQETPLIPVNPTEEEDVGEHESLNCPVQTNSESGGQEKDLMAMMSTQQNVHVESRPPDNQKSPATSIGISADVVAAASAALTAIMKSNEKGSMIDTNLLTKILSDPKMIEILSKGCGSSASSSAEECHISSLQKPLEVNTNLCSVLPKSQPIVNAFPSSFYGPTISSPLAYTPSLTVPTQSLPLSTPQSHAILSQNVNNTNQLLQASLSSQPNMLSSGSRMAVPLINYSASGLDNSSKPPVNEERTVPKTFAPPASSFSFRRPDAAAPAEFFTQSEDLLISRGQEMASSRRLNQSYHQENNLTSTALQFSSAQPDRPPVPSETPTFKNMDYYKNLVNLHGMERRETEGLHIPQSNSRASEPATMSGQRARVSVQRPCKFFNSAVGCKRGTSCPYQHDSLRRLQTGSVLDVPSSKRIRFAVNQDEQCGEE